MQASWTPLQPTESLLLADVAAEYARAGHAFTAAMDLVMDQRNTELIEKGEDLLRVRLANERTDPQRQLDDRPLRQLAAGSAPVLSSSA